MPARVMVPAPVLVRPPLPASTAVMRLPTPKAVGELALDRTSFKVRPPAAKVSGLPALEARMYW